MTTSTLHHGPPQALVVDDDPDSGRTLASRLKALGCKVLIVTRGQLREFLEVAGCDIAFVCDRPHGPSWESIVAQIRMSPAPARKIVLLVSHSVSVNKLVSTGVDDTFSEPIEAELLSRLIAIVEDAGNERLPAVHRQRHVRPGVSALAAKSVGTVGGNDGLRGTDIRSATRGKR